jgi:hypothetical protein
MRPCCYQRRKYGEKTVERDPEACSVCVAAFYIDSAIMHLTNNKPVKAYLAAVTAGQHLKDK